MWSSKGLGSDVINALCLSPCPCSFRCFPLGHFALRWKEEALSVAAVVPITKLHMKSWEGAGAAHGIGRNPVPVNGAPAAFCPAGRALLEHWCTCSSCSSWVSHLQVLQCSVNFQRLAFLLKPVRLVFSSSVDPFIKYLPSPSSVLNNGLNKTVPFFAKEHGLWVFFRFSFSFQMWIIC